MRVGSGWGLKVKSVRQGHRCQKSSKHSWMESGWQYRYIRSFFMILRAAPPPLQPCYGWGRCKVMWASCTAACIRVHAAVHQGGCYACIRVHA